MEVIDKIWEAHRGQKKEVREVENKSDEEMLGVLSTMKCVGCIKYCCSLKKRE